MNYEVQLVCSLMPLKVFEKGWQTAFSGTEMSKKELDDVLQVASKRSELLQKLLEAWKQELHVVIQQAEEDRLRLICSRIPVHTKGKTPREALEAQLGTMANVLELAFAFQIIEICQDKWIHRRVWDQLLVRWSLLFSRDPSNSALWAEQRDLLLKLLRCLLTNQTPRIQELLVGLHSKEMFYWMAGLKDLRDALLDVDDALLDVDIGDVQKHLKPPRLTGLQVGLFRGFDRSPHLQGFGNLNIFIGPNNSGKSSMMMALRRLSSLHEPSWPVVEQRWVQVFNEKSNERSYAPWFRVEDQCTTITSNTHSSVSYEVRAAQQTRSQALMVTFEVNALPGGNVVRDVAGKGWVQSQPRRFSEGPEQQRAGVFLYLGWHTIYVPSATGWDTPAELRSGERIYTRTSLYEDVLKWKVAYQEEGDSTLAELQRFLADVIGKSVELLARVEEQRLYVRLGEGLQALDAYGDGLKQLILIAAALHSLKRGLLLLEEPETALHPLWQRRLLKKLAEHEHVQTFLTTHSNHFLDRPPSTCSIYRFSNHGGERSIERMEADKMRQVLDDIGVRFSSLLLSNATIWVEGSTERQLVRDLLEMYVAHKREGGESWEDFEEGIHYSIAFLGGSLITKFDALIVEHGVSGIEPEKMCPDSFIISDADGFQKLENGLWYEWHRDAISEKYSVTVWKTEDGSSWQKIDNWNVDNGLPSPTRQNSRPCQSCYCRHCPLQKNRVIHRVRSAGARSYPRGRRFLRHFPLCPRRARCRWRRVNRRRKERLRLALHGLNWESGSPSPRSKLLRHVRMDAAFNQEGAFTEFYLLPARELESIHTRERYLAFLKKRQGVGDNTELHIPLSTPEHWRHHYIADVLRKYMSGDCPKLSDTKTKKPEGEKKERPEVYNDCALIGRYKDKLSNLAWYKENGGWEALSPLLQDLAVHLAEFIDARNNERRSLQ